MARKAIYKHATQVDAAAYPDDGSSPVGTNEWNEAPDAEGMFGNTPQTATITIASGVATVTDSVTVVAAETGTSDTLDKLSITNTNEFDLVYLFADTGDTITLTHNASPSVSGQISTVSDNNETLSSTSPTILIRKGNYWYGYGGGVVNAVNDIGDVTITNNSSGEILKWNGSAWVNQTLAEADIGSATAVALNTAKITYPSSASTKLAGIETGATADQTDAEIKAAVEAATDSNTFTDADHTKLNAIETSATADQTGAEIKTLYEAETNAFTDTKNTKLSGIETSATADQTDAEIRTAVESATDSNVFTDADHTKLNAIEASADVTDATNVNAAGAVMLSDTSTSGMGFVIDEDAMGSDSATKIPTQQSVVAYVASKIASSVTLKGNYNASTNSPDLDTTPISGIVAGDHYVVSTAGTFFTESLQAGDSIIAKQDSPTAITHWITVNNNMVTPIVTANIADDAVTGAKIADDAIDSEHYTDGSVDLAHMSANSVDSDQYVDGSIDLAHMSANSVDSDQYVDGSIDNIHIATGLDALKLADGTVTNAELQYINTLSSNAQSQLDLKAPLASPTLTTPTFDSYTDMGTITIPSNPSSGNGRVYVKTIDANNDGLFIKIKKAGGFVEVQLG